MTLSEQVLAAPDHVLLERFASRQDASAFEALVTRHGGMVLGVCRRVLKRLPDAEDACLATFLVLAQRAHTVRKSESVASWLHGVAFRASSNLRRETVRRSQREATAVDQGADPASPRKHVLPADPTWNEMKQALDQELVRLPESLRAPLVLCYLEGKTRDEAASQLGWTLTTLKGRLERGRDLLRSRLVTRGLTLSAAGLALVVSQNAMAALPETLAQSVSAVPPLATSGATVPAGAISAKAYALSQGVIKALWITKMKTVAAASIAAALVLTGAGYTYQVLSSAAAEPREVAQQAISSDTQKPVRAPQLPAKRELWTASFRGGVTTVTLAVTNLDPREFRRIEINRLEIQEGGDLIDPLPLVVEKVAPGETQSVTARFRDVAWKKTGELPTSYRVHLNRNIAYAMTTLPLTYADGTESHENVPLDLTGEDVAWLERENARNSAVVAAEPQQTTTVAQAEKPAAAPAKELPSVNVGDYTIRVQQAGLVDSKNVVMGPTGRPFIPNNIKGNTFTSADGRSGGGGAAGGGGMGGKSTKPNVMVDLLVEGSAKAKNLIIEIAADAKAVDDKSQPLELTGLPPMLGWKLQTRSAESADGKDILFFVAKDRTAIERIAAIDGELLVTEGKSGSVTFDAATLKGGAVKQDGGLTITLKAVRQSAAGIEVDLVVPAPQTTPPAPGQDPAVFLAAMMKSQPGVVAELRDSSGRHHQSQGSGSVGGQVGGGAGSSQFSQGFGSGGKGNTTAKGVVKKSGAKFGSPLPEGEKTMTINFEKLPEGIQPDSLSVTVTLRSGEPKRIPFRLTDVPLTR